MTDREIREIRINPIVPAESVLVATASSLASGRLPAHIDSHGF